MYNLNEKLNMTNLSAKDFLPTMTDIDFIVKCYLDYTAHANDQAWQKTHKTECPWLIAYTVCPVGRHPDERLAIKYFILALILDWKELIGELTRTLHNSYKLAQEDWQEITNLVMPHIDKLIKAVDSDVQNPDKFVMTAQAPAATNPSATVPTKAQVVPQAPGIFNKCYNPNTNFCYFSAYDSRYTPPARRHIEFRRCLGSNTYGIGVDGATRSNPANTYLFFDSVAQATNFAKNFVANSQAMSAKYLIINIIDKLFTLDNEHVGDLSKCELVHTPFGDAYMLKHCKFHESLDEGTEKVKDHKWVNRGDEGTNGYHEDFDIEENIEKHDELNPKLFDGDKLRPEVKDKINELVELFKDELKQNDIDIDIKDIVIIGSNASYNYTDDSDLDVHLVLGNVDDKLAKIYDLCRSNFNAKFDPEYYGIPVEIYVEVNGLPHISNGCYSIMNDKWINEPDKDKIPEPDQKAIDDKLKDWEVRYNNLLDEINIYLGKDAPVETDKEHDGSFGDAMTAFTDESLEEDLDNKPLTDIEKFIDDAYELRKEGMEGEGEYDDRNLMFKELRNRGYLDNLKELRDKVISKELSLIDDSRYFGGKMPEPVNRDFEAVKNDMEENWFDEGEDEEIDGYLVHNVPESAKKHEFIVARYSEDHEDLWYYGAWDDEDVAEKVANKLYNGKLIYRHGYDYSH